MLDRLDQLREVADAARVYLRGGRSMSHPGSGGDPDAMERLRNFQDALARLDSDTPATEPGRVPSSSSAYWCAAFSQHIVSVTVADSILADLEEGGWVCGTHFLATYRPTYAQRISIELRSKRGLAIESRACKRHEHRGGVHEYRLVREPEQLRLIE